MEDTAPVKFVVISDTHGDHRKLSLPPGDIVVHAGDLTAHGTEHDAQDFIDWFDGLNFKHKLLVAGNHDWYLESDAERFVKDLESTSVIYLNDSGIELEGIRFWGSPVTLEFYQWAFQRKSGEDIEKHWRLIPPQTDILITHSPPHGIMDEVPRDESWENRNSASPPSARNKNPFVHAGCRQLLQRIIQVKPSYHIFGHIHEGYGQQTLHDVRFINASSMNAQYQLQNQPVVFEYGGT